MNKRTIKQRLDDMAEHCMSIGAQDDVKLIQKTAMEKADKIEAEIRAAKKELRHLQAKRRVKVEALGFVLEILNLTVAPGLILGIAVALALVRWLQARKYAARRT